MGLHEKLARIQGELGVIGKTGHNKNQNYSFANEQSFLDAVRPLTSREGLSMVVSNTLHSYEIQEKAEGKFNYIAVVNTTLVITDGKSGESVTATAVGVGHDAGDKAVYKAQTGGAKYAYWKAFALATGDDPEKDSETKKTFKPRSKSNDDII